MMSLFTAPRTCCGDDENWWMKSQWGVTLNLNRIMGGMTITHRKKTWLNDQRNLDHQRVWVDPGVVIVWISAGKTLPGTIPALSSTGGKSCVWCKPGLGSLTRYPKVPSISLHWSPNLWSFIKPTTWTLLGPYPSVGQDSRNHGYPLVNKVDLPMKNGDFP